MLDDHYPTVDIAFLDSVIRKCDNVEDVIDAGRTNAYILKGTKPVIQRTIVVRDTGDGQVSYLMATGICGRLKCMGALLVWLEANRKWKDGGYIVK